MLRTGGLGAVAATTGAASWDRRAAPTVVLVHGANGNGASYAPLTAELAAAGLRTLAVDLPGHGASGHFPASYQAPQDLPTFAVERSPVLARITLADNVRHVVGVVRRVAAHGPVMLVGQSMGGATITRAANEVPHLVSRLVYLSAFCCVRFRSVVDCYLSPEGATTLIPLIPSVGDPQRLGVTRTNWRSADPAFLSGAKAALAAEYDDGAFRALLNGMEPDESAAVPADDARGEAHTWGRVPRSYIRFTRDRALPLALQDRMIREADAATPGNRFDVHSLPAPHVGPEDPRPLAKIVAGLAYRR
ncbi:alpha/beta hydrolase [Micromonospora sp. URMC 106]|uniref:alpha/beta hydrolase n=1 Tax=Micromonospora sp. URMC 106 TaxID=3423408 RepID=UPI003F19C7CC